MICRDIPGYEGLYTIREDGLIYSIKSKKIMKTTLNRGYLVISLCKDSIRKQYKHHRLLMLTFLPNINHDELVINHINGIRDDNRLENLEWCSVEQNNNHAIENGLNRGKNKLDDKQVIQIKKMIKELEPGTIRSISSKISKHFDVSPRTIESIIVNKRWSHIHI